MAKKIHDGKGFDVFFWGQNYMGPLTSALAAAIRKTVLDPAGIGAEGGPISLRLAGMSEIAFGVCLYFLALTRLFGWTIAAAAGLWMAMGPPLLIRLSAIPKGPEMSFALSSVLFFLAAGALTRPRPFLDRHGGHFTLGFLAGLGWWMNQTIGFVLLRRSRPSSCFAPLRFAGFSGVGSSGEPPSNSWRGWARLTTPPLCGSPWAIRPSGWAVCWAGT